MGFLRHQLVELQSSLSALDGILALQIENNQFDIEKLISENNRKIIETAAIVRIQLDEKDALIIEMQKSQSDIEMLYNLECLKNQKSEIEISNLIAQIGVVSTQLVNATLAAEVAMTSRSRANWWPWKLLFIGFSFVVATIIGK